MPELLAMVATHATDKMLPGKHNFLRKNEIKMLKMIFPLHLCFFFILFFLFEPTAIFRQIKA